MSDAPKILGMGELRYTAVPAWEQLPVGWSFFEATSVATNSPGEVFVFNRGHRPMIVLDRCGAVINTWESVAFARPHGITIGPNDEVYCVDDVDHTVAVAKKAFRSWSRVTAKERGDLTRKLADIIEEHADDIARLKDQGVLRTA